MLDTNYILRGLPIKHNIPEGWSTGEYFTDCIKKRNPQEIFCVDGITGKSFTCREILDQTFKTVIILRELGVKSGDTVAIISENCVKYCTTQMAIYYVGAAANLLNPTYTTGELKRALNMTKPKVIFSSITALEKLYKMKEESLFMYQIILFEKTLSAEIVLLDELLETTTLDIEKMKPAKFDGKKQTALILLSSGTTGLPKCVMLTHENTRTISACFGDQNLTGIKSDDSTIAVLPFFHILGTASITIACLYSIKLVIFPRFHPDAFLRCIETYQITLLITVPSIVSFLANHSLIKTLNLSSLKTIICAGGCLGTEIQNQFSKWHINTRIIQLYGATETSGCGTLHPRNNTYKSESVGKLVPNAGAMIWQPDLCKNVGPLKTGEFCIRGPMLMKDYIEEKNNIDEYGFYHTGDLGYYDEEGYFYIVGRIKELIKYKGYQVAPAELENIIIKHKAVAECAVIGIPDERAGQLPTAFVVRQQEAVVTEKEIIDFLAERISVHKQLHGGVRFLDSIPKNPAGKVSRSALLELYITL